MFTVAGSMGIVGNRLHHNMLYIAICKGMSVHLQTLVSFITNTAASNNSLHFLINFSMLLRKIVGNVLFSCGANHQGISKSLDNIYSVN